MGRQGLTYEEVELVAEKLLQEGHSPTIEKVRYKLGTGSNSTISRYLSDWKSHRLIASTNVLPALNTPPDPVNQAVSRVWQQLQEENEIKIKEIEAAAKQKIDEVNAERLSAIDEKDRLAEDNQVLRNLLKEARQQNAELEKKQIDINQKYAAVEAKLSTLEGAYSDFKKMAEQSAAEVNDKHEEIANRLSQQLDTLEKNKNNVISEIKQRAEDNRHQYIAEIDALKIEKERLQKQNCDFEKAIAELAQSVNKQNDDFNKSVIDTKQIGESIISHVQRLELTHQQHHNDLSEEFKKIVQEELYPKKTYLVREIDTIDMERDYVIACTFSRDKAEDVVKELEKDNTIMGQTQEGKNVYEFMYIIDEKSITL